jgi:hypothetical protein
VGKLLREGRVQLSVLPLASSTHAASCLLHTCCISTHRCNLPVVAALADIQIMPLYPLQH